MNAASGEAGPPDAELVAGVLAGDREAFAAVYDRYGDRLFDFAHSMLRQREDAEDAVADSFVLVAERLGQLREPDRLRPWLYAIVRSECLRRLKARKRVAYGGEEQLVDMADTSMTPDAEAEQAMLRDLVWDASAGLADRDRAMLDLHLRQGLEGAELGEAMGVTASNAYVMLNRLKGQVERSLGALLIARLGRDDCDDLDGILVDWDGRFSPLVRKRVARHVDDCDVCSDRRRRMVSPLTLLAGVPLVAAPLSLRDRVVDDTRLVAYSEPSTPFLKRRRNQAGAAAAAAVVIAGTALLWPGGADDPATTAASEQATSTTPPPTESPTPTPDPTEGGLLAGTITVSTQLIDLGTDGTSAPVRLTNTGDQTRTYPGVDVEAVAHRLPRQRPAHAGWLGEHHGEGRSFAAARRCRHRLTHRHLGRRQCTGGSPPDSGEAADRRPSVARSIGLRVGRPDRQGQRPGVRRLRPRLRRAAVGRTLRARESHDVSLGLGLVGRHGAVLRWRESDAERHRDRRAGQLHHRAVDVHERRPLPAVAEKL